MGLDELYGEAIHPEPCSDPEKAVQPESLHELDDRTGPLLQRLVAIAEDGLLTIGCVYSNVPILWVIGEDGKMRFSLEEVVAQGTMRRLRPRLVKEALRDGETRLGHPALLCGGKGRIGGELLYDPGWGATPAGWKLTNSSGRYGMLPIRNEKQLANAAQLLQNYGILVDTAFYTRRKVK